MQVVHDGKTAFCEIHRADYAATGAIPSDTEELVNSPRSITGVQVAMVFMEQPIGGVKISFRRDPIDVSKIAESFGGGGHRLAAGTSCKHRWKPRKRRCSKRWPRPLASKGRFIDTVQASGRLNFTRLRVPSAMECLLRASRPFGTADRTAYQLLDSRYRRNLRGDLWHARYCLSHRSTQSAEPAR